jgi:hypothetical protein
MSVSNGWESSMEHGIRYVHHQGYSGATAQVLVEPPKLTVLAHVSGNSIDCLHCPFCGSGAIVARSDGTIECSFCTSCFTVQVQPQFPAFPMTTQGQPYPWPGQPDPASVVAPGSAPMAPGDPLGGGIGGAPEDINAVDPNDPDADGADESGDDSDAPPWLKGKSGDSDAGDDKKAQVGGKSAPPFVKKKSYLTVTGAQLSEQDYIRHLAIAHAQDKRRVASLVKASRT